MTNNKQYPPLPDFEEVEQHIYGASRRYIPQDMLEPIHDLMRAYVDTDRAMRAARDAEDAARYRYLKQHATLDSPDVFYWLRCAPAAEVDSIIDAARAQQEHKP